MTKSYVDAWTTGNRAGKRYGVFAVLARPFWRGVRYLHAWDNGRERARWE